MGKISLWRWQVDMRQPGQPYRHSWIWNVSHALFNCDLNTPPYIMGNKKILFFFYFMLILIQWETHTYIQKCVVHLKLILVYLFGMPLSSIGYSLRTGIMIILILNIRWQKASETYVGWNDLKEWWDDYLKALNLVPDSKRQSKIEIWSYWWPVS